MYGCILLYLRFSMCIFIMKLRIIHILFGPRSVALVSYLSSDVKGEWICIYFLPYELLLDNISVNVPQFCFLPHDPIL